MTWCFIITYILNIVDLFFTVYWVDMYGISAEANPIGRFLFDNGLVEVVKVFVVGMLIVFLYGQAHIEENKLAKIGLIICTIVYVIVFIIHLVLWFYIH